METSRDEGKMVIPVPGYDDEGEEDEEDNKRKRALNPSKRRGASSGGSTQRSCQVEDCTVDMTATKPYHRRHKVCEFHAKAAVVVLSGQQQRFCQQCSREDHIYCSICSQKTWKYTRFHDLAEFDEAKRSCRRRLAGHNERRRKNSYDSQ